jgi:hypothetical protein
VHPEQPAAFGLRFSGRTESPPRVSRCARGRKRQSLCKSVSHGMHRRRHQQQQQQKQRQGKVQESVSEPCIQNRDCLALRLCDACLALSHAWPSQKENKAQAETTHSSGFLSEHTVSGMHAVCSAHDATMFVFTGADSAIHTRQCLKDRYRRSSRTELHAAQMHGRSGRGCREHASCID